MPRLNVRHTVFTCTALLVAACSSGGSSEQVVTSQNALGEGWTRCANEWASCSFSGTRRVRYGVEGNWVIKTLTGGTPCTNAVFGDPAVGVTKSCELEDAPTPTPTPTSTSTSTSPPTPSPGPYIDMSKIPKGNPGIGEREFGPAPGPFAKADIGLVRFVCQYSHMSKDDPLVFPNQPGAAHLHTFFGNKLANAYSTAASLLNAGDSTCYGGIVNRSAYWVPTVVDANGVPQRPVQGNFYYKAGFEIPSNRIQTFPTGLRMIAGNAKADSPQHATVAGFGCNESPGWTCPGGTDKMPYLCASIPQCGMGKRLTQYVGFPQCWDGINLDSPNHMSHMAYPSGGTCPATHPVPIPHVEYILEYVQTSANTNGWRLSSDTYDASKPGGFSNHGDYMSAWEQPILDTFVRECDQKSLDCQDGPIGDGRGLTNRRTWEPFPN
jgi:hypothetical protein